MTAPVTSVSGSGRSLTTRNTSYATRHPHGRSWRTTALSPCRIWLGPGDASFNALPSAAGSGRPARPRDGTRRRVWRGGMRGEGVPCLGRVAVRGHGLGRGGHDLGRARGVRGVGARVVRFTGAGAHPVEAPGRLCAERVGGGERDERLAYRMAVSERVTRTTDERTVSTALPRLGSVFDARTWALSAIVSQTMRHVTRAVVNGGQE